MAWFNDYARDYDRAAGYDRSRPWRDSPGMRSTPRGYDRGWSGRNREGGRSAGPLRSDDRGGYWGESSTRVDYDRDYLGRQYGYDSGYDYQYRRRPPEQSPFYGRDADTAVQRWARRYGYDLQYEIDPRSGGGRGGYAGGRRHRGYGF